MQEPHAGIISMHKTPNTLNMTSIDSAENQKICMELARDNINNLKSSVRKGNRSDICSHSKKNTLDNWISTDNSDSNYQVSEDLGRQNYIERYEMPRRLDWNVFRKIYDIQPQNYEQLISVPGVGPAAVELYLLLVK